MLLVVWLVAGLLHCGRAGELYSTVEAHGPLARQALDIYRNSGAQHHSPPTVLAATAHDVPTVAVTPAPVDVVHHVPSVVDVPVTKFVAQPGYIQRLVNVPKADIATAKLEVRRPAVEKKFYDIEHRTVVRPVGSAVVQFEQPIAKKYLTPFIDSSGGRHTIAQFHRPVVYPVFSHPFYSPQYVPGQTAQYFPGHVIPQYVPGQAYPSFTPIQIPQRPFLPPQQTPVVPQQPQRPPVLARPPPPQAPLPSIPSPDDIETNSEFDPTDTVVVDNPDFTKSKNTTDSIDENNETEDSFEDFAKDVDGETKDFVASEQEDFDAIQHILDEFEQRQNLRKLLRQNDFQPNDLDKLHQITHQSMTNQEGNLEATSNTKISTETSATEPQSNNLHVLEHSEPSFNFKVVTNSDETAINKNQDDQQSYSRSLLEHSEPKFSFKIVPVPDNFEQDVGTSTPTLQEQSSSTTPNLETSRSSQRSSFDIENTNSKDTIGNEAATPNFKKLSSEELQDLYQKLIKLVTVQGWISEVARSRPGIEFDPTEDLGGVRGKVVSVTAAPKSSQAEEHVSTRRVVVSRPVHTVQEVDVHHPVTRLQSVAVHEPTLVQTAHTTIARVPTTLPVLSRTLAYH